MSKRTIRSGWSVGLATPKVAGSTPGLALSGNNLGQVVHTCVPLSPSSIIWEGNRRSGVALTMRHRLQWFIHLPAHGIRKGDEPTLLMGYGIPLLFTRVGVARLTSAAVRPCGS